MHKKQNLPTKTCVVCARPFTWRKKWEKVWDEVKYCSDRCRNGRSQANRAASSTT
ncbi:MAG: DUF2256 domain-containing protein [Cyclobacteriaceae bacterium]|nr:DUF2256 domain-containing protein [Cyclobacteriaceae bacterium]